MSVMHPISIGKISSGSLAFWDQLMSNSVMVISEQLIKMLLKFLFNWKYVLYG